MSNGRKPDFNVFTSSAKDSNAKPRQIGVGWYHDKGEGFGIVLDATPIDGKIVCFPPKDQEQADKQ